MPDPFAVLKLLNNPPAPPPQIPIPFPHPPKRETYRTKDGTIKIKGGSPGDMTSRDEELFGKGSYGDQGGGAGKDGRIVLGPCKSVEPM